MNRLVHESLAFILRETDAWEKIRDGKYITGYKPRMNYIRDQLQMAREAMFYDDVYFPHLQRFMRKVKDWNLFPNVTWEKKSVGYAREIRVWILFDTDLQDEIASCLQYYLENTWNSEQWDFSVTEAEVMAMGIRPEIMEAVQVRMF